MLLKPCCSVSHDPGKRISNMTALRLLVLLKFKVNAINGICGVIFKRDLRKIQSPTCQLYETSNFVVHFQK